LTRQGNRRRQEDRRQEARHLRRTIGFVLAVTGAAAGLSENAPAIRPVKQASENYSTVSKS
jgi:hypothetical protein